MLQRSLAQLLKIGVSLVFLYCWYYSVTIWITLKTKIKVVKILLKRTQMPGWMKVYISLLLYLSHEKELIFEPQSRKLPFLYSILTTRGPAQKNDEYNKTNHIFFRKRLPVRTQWQKAHQLFGKENCKSFSNFLQHFAILFILK